MTFIFHHIGVAVSSVEKATEMYHKLGYEVSESIIEPTQKVIVRYATKVNSPIIELLEPLNESSPITSVIKRSGSGPYHVCYAVNDITEAVVEMKKQGFMPLSRPVPGNGLDGALTVFLYNKTVGLIQLAEIK